MYMLSNVYSISYLLQGRELKNDEQTSITSSDGVSCLLLQNITADDSGKYDISVENRFGADCNYASVSVEGPPDAPSGTPCVSANMDSVTVAWSSSPYDGGKIVTGYAVEYSLAGSDVWTTATEDCYSLSYTISGLQPGARYIFRVRAQNVHGYSKPSQESDTLLLEEKSDSAFEPRIVALEPGPEFKLRYEVMEELGKGRFGVVHKVIEKTTSQKLAAKFIKCRTSKDRDKVQDEIDIMNLLRHQKLLQLAAAFENPKEMVMVTEYISGGELFERVVADDFTLTEKDCILFMRQICEGVAYMHSLNIVHLDLKPENIMCHTRTSHEIKIIDFGLAQKLNPDKPIRVLFGTPEFIPPEIINYEPIGVESDMWSLGVICYVLLSGLSPFMGDNDAETFANITRADYDFEDEAFNTVSQHARDFIGALLVKRKDDRLSAEQCLKHIWLDPENHKSTVVLSTDKLKKFIIRRKWQKTGNAIRALGRMATLSASRRNSANSNPNTPRASITGRMSSLNEEETNNVYSLESEPKSLPVDVICDDNITSVLEENVDDTKKTIHGRACTERSDSGISDCSSHLTSSSCTSTPLFGKKIPIDEEPELDTGTLHEDVPSPLEEQSAVVLNTPKDNSCLKDVSEQTNSSNESSSTEASFDDINETKKSNGLNLESKIDTLTKRATAKCKSPSSTGSLKRLPIYSSRSVAKTIKKFDKIEKSPKTVVNNRFDKDQNSKLSNKDKNEVNMLEVNNKLNSVKTISSPIQQKKIFSSPKFVENKNESVVCKSKVEKIVQKMSVSDSNAANNNNNNINLKPVGSVKCKCPSPSLLRKTQAVIAKEQSNEYYMSKHNHENKVHTPKHMVDQNSKFPKSPVAGRREKPKSASFQKAAAFWNSPKT
ncbi:hypothetical protein Zmor_007204 [Zophobas morio]|uniref:Myosin light chain kinase, smooth muscle n=1 Tax=Zophobas morio TaxID=2755281 RepID=A0AA38MND6_9CUCU|nr:hypothetical protein Zmor_007204 [Zophobas morio]